MSTPGKVRFGIEGVREFAQQRVEATSLRAVAAEIGMSNSGLHSFLRGGEPYNHVRKKLIAWFMRLRYPESRPIAAGEIDAATSLLAAYLRQADPKNLRGRRFLQISEQIAAEGEVHSSVEPASDHLEKERPEVRYRRTKKSKARHR